MKSLKYLLITFLFSGFAISQSKDYKYYQNIIDTTNNKEEKLVALDSITQKSRQKSAEERLKYTEDLIDLAIELEDYELAVDKMIRIFHTVNIDLNQPDRALNLIKQLEPHLEKVKDSYLVAGFYIKKGGGLFNGKDFSKAIENYTKAINYYTKKDSIFKADAIYFRGQANQYVGRFLEAVEDYKLASTYYENLNDLQYTLYTKSSVATLYSNLGFYDKAIIETKKIIEEKIAKKFPDGLSEDHYNLALIYKHLNDLEKEEKALLDSYKYLENSELSYIITKVQVASLLASLNMQKGEEEKALNYLKIAENTLKDTQEESYAGFHYYINKAEILYLKNNFEEAEKIVNASLPNIETFNSNSLKSDFYDLLYRIYKAKNNNKKALFYFEKNKTLNDSIYNLKKTNALSYYQTLYETEKQQKEIEKQEASITLLQTQNTAKQRLILFLIIGSVLTLALLGLFLNRKRLKKEKELQANYAQNLLLSQELERKRISKDLHDGLGQSLLLIKNQVALKKDENTKNLLNSAIEEMRSISRTLHPFQLEDIGITKALENLISQIDNNSETYVFGDISDLSGKLNHTQEVNVFRIVQECLSNIIKHAKADSAKVSVLEVKNHVNITIQDNGVGFDFSEKYNDFKSLGLKTIKERVKFLDGTLKINSVKNEGTTFEILFPIT